MKKAREQRRSRKHDEDTKRPGDLKGSQAITSHLIPAVNSACRGKFAFQRASTGVPGEDWI